MAVRKTISIIFLIMFSGCAGMPVVPEGEKDVVSVVEANGKTKDQIYIATKAWIAETFKSAKAVIEVDSRQDGLIIGNGIIPYPCSGVADCMGTGTFNVSFTLKSEIKDNKYRISFTNIHILTPAQPGAYGAGDNPIHWQKDMDKIKPKLLQLTNNLASSISAQSKSDF